ncbi:hypothetical protein Psta_0667 [Pirellula staleyi DSM 6068]|uniref:Zinc-ribbon domain-containing protein n=1 Tax=Pirellula staleyi (strain ATCC 27377 / DSM 6068 / ICPB 4128) TaxID=530564 RepID=D2R594_PIRSD|nr:hypothetical protein [Pirellula staleyi]ADB15353.1 hypothetical protein Psta_0667 [Pirellula staleyi DSM 6068]
MSHLNEQTRGRLCARCRQPLPPETSFCVGCGLQNGEDELIGRQIGFDQQIESRLLRLRMYFVWLRLVLRRMWPWY